jgi:signal transduction histidine kinase/DNA-binding response OmpR family regulator
VRKDGATFHVSASAVAVYDQEGRYTMSRSTLTDITQRKLAEAELRLRQQELSAANAALAKAAKLKDEFLASMSHELRTPLTGILGLSEALQTEVYGTLNAKQAKTIHSIEESGRHLLNLINDILDLSKIEAGKLELEPSVFPVDELCQASLRLVKQMAATKGQSVTYTLSPAGLTMRADPRRLKQALVNLLSNAVKFTPEGGSLGLEVHGDPERKVMYFSVWDKGIGIAPEDAEKLFKPFIQLDSGLARSRTGTGLGLSLVHRLAEMHGGSVTLESAAGDGSRFTVALPWFAEAAIPVDLRRAGSRSTAAIDSALLVEDSLDTSESLSTYLKELGIEQIIVHARVEGAAERAAAAQPAVIFLDILLPDGSGWELLRRLKADSRTRNIPVIVVSVVDDQPRARQLGAAHYLHKPVSRSDVQVSLEQAQRARAQKAVEPVMVIVEKPPGYTLLLAEDHEINRQLIQDYLGAKGYQVVVAVNGQEAVDLVKELRPTLVLMDVQMPEMDGLEATRAIRAMGDPVLAQLPIIALTALAMPGDRERCLTAGASAYLSKPVDLAALNTLIGKLIEENR